VEQTIEVKPSYGLTDQEVERMLIESFEHAETDIEMRLLIEARNEAETVIHATENSLRRQDFEQLAAEVFEPGERARLDAALVDAIQAFGAADRARVQQTTEALNQATRHLAEVVMNRSVREALAGKNVKDV
jgi:molecular chaperone DnaK (HSP70)